MGTISSIILPPYTTIQQHPAVPPEVEIDDEETNLAAYLQCLAVTELAYEGEETRIAKLPVYQTRDLPSGIRAGCSKPLARQRRQRSTFPCEWTTHTNHVDNRDKGRAIALNEVEEIHGVAAGQADCFGIPTIRRHDRSRRGIGGPLHPRPTLPRKHRSVTMGDDGDGPAITPSADDGRTTTI